MSSLLDLPPSNETTTGARIWWWSQAKEESRCHEGRSLPRSRLLASCVRPRWSCHGVRRCQKLAARFWCDGADVLPVEEGVGRSADGPGEAAQGPGKRERSPEAAAGGRGVG